MLLERQQKFVFFLKEAFLFRETAGIKLSIMLSFKEPQFAAISISFKVRE
jgi:hypothetical protein